ncbi:hypothetical protein ARMGADRAFT_809775 [Armillaria gallica]|uniref:Uncharacterized protein n=1 Tax=Armillaria gallica TaxID=47427 RepID=A0A2H3DKA9_ARMGA|nr:hypothetical protein ARMGADRAFT_809775 [Armillaria gallica]
MNALIGPPIRQHRTNPWGCSHDPAYQVPANTCEHILWQLAHRNPCQIRRASSLVKFKRARLHFMTSIRVAGFPTRTEQRNIRKLYASRGNGNSIVWNSDGAKRTVTLSGPWAFNVRLSEEGKVEDRETGQMEYAMPRAPSNQL